MIIEKYGSCAATRAATCFPADRQVPLREATIKRRHYAKPSRERAQALLTAVSIERLTDDVRTLLGPRSRLHAPERIAEVEDQLMATLRGTGLDGQTRPFSLTNAPGNFDLGTHGEGNWERTVYTKLDGRNILATKKGRTDDVIIVGAHYDTIRCSPGADDNTASLAALLEVARLVADLQFEQTILFVAFDMEEIGYHGSRAFVREQLDGREVVAALIFESMAFTSTAPNSQKMPPGFPILYPQQARKIRARHYAGDWAAVLYREPAGRLARLYATCIDMMKGVDTTVLLRDPCDLPVIGGLLYRTVPFTRDFGRSDHVAFWDHDLPAVMVTDTANFRNPHYHQPTDLPDTLDIPHLSHIVAGTVLALECVSSLTAAR